MTGHWENGEPVPGTFVSKEVHVPLEMEPAR